jgi:Rrf2 family protein
MRLQTATRIAVFAILELAAAPAKQLSAAEIARRFGISVNHLAKVLRALGRAGLVEALRGVGGGYRFRGNAKRMTLLDVILLFEAVGPSADGSREPGAGTPEGRALARVVKEIDETARATLSSITVATMLKLVGQEEGQPAPRRSVKHPAATAVADAAG